MRPTRLFRIFIWNERLSLSIIAFNIFSFFVHIRKYGFTRTNDDDYFTVFMDVILQKLLWKDDFEGQQKLYAALSLSNILLFNTNFAVNFLLYCLSGRNFRKSLKNILLRKPKRMALNRISRKSKTQTVRNRSAFDSRKTDNETVIFDEITVGEPLSTHYHPTHPPTISPVERETRT